MYVYVCRRLRMYASACSILNLHDLQEDLPDADVDVDADVAGIVELDVAINVDIDVDDNVDVGGACAISRR